MTLAISTNSNAAKWRVNNIAGIDADFTSLNVANNNAAVNNGDTIYIEGSVNVYENATISKQLTVIGPGYFLGENDSTQANLTSAKIQYITLETGSEKSLITGLNILYAITLLTDNITISRNLIGFVYFHSANNCLIIQNYITNDISSAGSSSHSCSPIIRNNIVSRIIIDEYSSAIIYNNVIYGGTSSSNRSINVHNSIVRNNILTAGDDGSGFGLDLEINGEDNNTITNNIIAQTGTDSDNNQYNTDMTTVFVDFESNLGYSTDAKWQIKTGSPSISAGINGDGCGAFFGNNHYVLSGMPPVPHIFESIVPVAGSQTSGLHVTVKIKSQN